ncbi:hypothetical protein BX666DRAFT_1870976 [Dichotomocladium elegans]|nr:hypothetical protein BX666DRAFT_1870976 [Dichotomocladium elegans]
MATPATHAHVLSLYRSFLRSGKQFASYNFREYTLRRSRDAFRAHASETDPEKIAALIDKATKDLEVVKRQALISILYSSGDKLVIENSSAKPRVASIKTK